MFHFRLLNGTHAEGDVTYNTGDCLESEHNLAKLFPKRFEILAPKTPPAPVVEEVVPEEVVVEEVVEALGDDVTAGFPTAAAAGVLVFKNGNVYYVADAAEPHEAIHAEPIKTKKAVGELISSLSPKE